MADAKTFNDYQETDFLVNRTLVAYSASYARVALRFAEGEVTSFTTREHSVADRFEVFPIARDDAPVELEVWNILSPPFSILSVTQLWREEWREQVVDDGRFMGSGPHHVVCAGKIGSSRPDAAELALVNAGLLLRSTEGHGLVICSSSKTPFKIDVASDVNDIASIMAEHSKIP